MQSLRLWPGRDLVKWGTIMSKDTNLSHKERLKAFLLDGNMVNWRISEAEESPEKPFYIRSLPQRIHEIDNELQEQGIGFIEGELMFSPRRTDYRLVRYTNEDNTSKDT